MGSLSGEAYKLLLTHPQRNIVAKFAGKKGSEAEEEGIYLDRRTTDRLYRNQMKSNVIVMSKHAAFIFPLDIIIQQ